MSELSEESRRATTLRIATYNIHKGVGVFGRSIKIHGIKEAIAALNADLVFLQEVQGQHDHHAVFHPQWPKQGQHEFLAGESHHVAYGMNAVYEHGHHGNALLSRYPIVSSVNHDVSDHAYEQRGILHSITQMDGVDIHCFVIHLGLFSASRKRQVNALIQAIQNAVPAHAPVIVAGDFNDWSMRLSERLYQQLGMIEAFDVDRQHAGQAYTFRGVRALLPNWRAAHARTFPAGLPWLCLDRVYLRGFDVLESEVLSGSPWDKLSDHVPIAVTLSLR